MGCLAALLCLTVQASAIVPTKDVETPFACLKAFKVVSKSHSFHWSHGVYDTYCDYVSDLSENDLLNYLNREFAKYKLLPDNIEEGSYCWTLLSDGIKYRFKLQKDQSYIRHEQGDTVKIEVKSGTKLSMQMTVPLDGQNPRKWWNEAIFRGTKPPIFQWDMSVVAVGGKPERFNSGFMYQAIVNRPVEQYAFVLGKKLLSIGYEKVREDAKVYCYRNTKRHAYSIRLWSAGKDRTYIEWNVTKRLLQ